MSYFWHAENRKLLAYKCTYNFPSYFSCVLLLPENTLTNECKRCLPHWTPNNITVSLLDLFKLANNNRRRFLWDME